jgi:hydroxysqualene dehydroxylase
MTAVSIIGAGWSGLAAAVELSRHNIPVTVYESAKQIGGRARDIDLDGVSLDNGQHLMIGAYIQLLALLKVTGVNEADVFYRLPQHIQMLDLATGNIAFELKLPRWPAPLHLLSGMLGCSSLNLSEKIKTLWRFNKLLNNKLTVDISVEQWLNQADLPPTYADNLLKPLCLAALTTYPDQASARTFQTVLQQTFNGRNTNTDLLISRTTLGKIFPDAAKRYIESHGGQVLVGHKIDNIDLANKIIRANNQNLHYQQLVIATPPTITQQLLKPHAAFDTITSKLAALQYAPVCTIYLQYPPHIKLPLPMLGCLHSTSEWLFDRVYCNQPGLIAVIISADGHHMSLSNDDLVNNVKSELAQLFPNWPEPVNTRVIREKRAGFSCRVDVDSIRPSIRTDVDHIKLCGDYVYIENNLLPGLPATLEGAVRSGVKCAQQTLEDMQTCNT